MSLLASVQLSNITQHIASITTPGRLTNIVVTGIYRRTTALTETDRRVTSNGAFCLRRRTTRCY